MTPGVSTRYTYDALNRLTQTQYPDGTQESTEYDAAGQVVATVDRQGARTGSEYDAAGRVIASADASGRKTRYAYDANGNRTSVTLPDGRITQYTYDALNRLTLTQYPDGSQSSTVYRTDGRKESETDARGIQTSYTYDATGRLTAVKQGSTAASYQYDETGAKIGQTDASNRNVAWQYDAGGRPQSRTLPDGSKESYEYDAAGNRLTHVSFGGQRIQTTWNSAEQATSLVIPALSSSNGSVPARTVQWSYTADGQIASQTESGNTSPQGTTRYEYDANGRPTQISTPQGSLAFSYDAAGRITQRSVTPKGASDAIVTRYTYDQDGRLTSLVAPDGKQTAYAYDATGRLLTTTQALASGSLVTERRYYVQDRMVAIAHLKQSGGSSALILGQRIQRATGGAVSRIDRFDTTASFDAASGQFTGTPSEALSYAYDDSARLVAESRYAGGELTAWLADSTQAATERTTYQYDAVSNRSQKQHITAAGTETTQYSYDANDRLLSETLTSATGSTRSTTYTWDANGNLAGKQTPETYTGYLFDADNRLIEVRQGSSATTATSIARYRYDADGQRIAKTTTSGTTQYLIDPTTIWPQVAAEVQTPADGSATQSTAYVWGTSLLRQTRGGQGTLYAQASSDLIPLEGQLGTVLGAIDADGNLVEQYERDAFGNALDDTTAHAQLTHQYTGEYFDQDIGLQYNRARWYGSQIGLFLGLDPMQGRQRDTKSLNRYTYAQGNPIYYADPSGCFGLVEMSVAEDVRSILSGIQIDFGSNLIGASLTGEMQSPLLGFGLIAMGGAGVKLVITLAPKMRPFFQKIGLTLAEARISKLMGADFEEYLSKMTGSKGEFVLRGSAGVGRFDGWIEKEKILYEAKSGWNTSIISFKQQIAVQQKIATEAGVDYVVISNKIIPDAFKDWMDMKGVRYIEILD